MPKQGLPQDDFAIESPPLEALQTIDLNDVQRVSAGNATLFNHWADVQAVVQSESVSREGAMESFQGVQKSSSFGIDVGCLPQV